MYRKYYSYNDMPVVKQTPEKEIKIQETKPQQIKKESQKDFLSNLENDDIILLIVFFILIMDNCNDNLLLLALAFIFLADYFT